MVVKHDEAGGFVRHRGAESFSRVYERADQAAHLDLEGPDDAVPDIEKQDAEVLDTVVVARAKGVDRPYRRAGVLRLWAVFHTYRGLAHE
jgi:hypothetical protein